MTQNHRVLAMLTVGWVCATEFLDEDIPRAGARIFELRGLGHDIERQLCRNPQHHHKSRQFEWRLAPTALLAFDPDGQGAWAVSA